MTKIDPTGKGTVRRQTCAIEATSRHPICVEVGPHYLTIWPLGTRRKLTLHYTAAYEAAAKIAARYTDPGRDRKRRSWR